MIEDPKFKKTSCDLKQAHLRDGLSSGS